MVTEIQEAIKASPRVVIRGAGTKTALARVEEGATVLDASALRGVIEYEPAEFTFTAWAGTPAAEVQALLAEHGQYLPFDPPLAARGATLGGTVAAGLSGPGRYRYGGVRDFILGVRFVDGTGQLVRGGGKVVKNAAGFDLPKLMVGSLGQYGPLVDLSFKVFPRPEDYVTVRLAWPSLDEAVAGLLRLYGAPLDIDALDLVPAATGGAAVWARLGGLQGALPARAERVRQVLGGGEVLAGEAEAEAWRAARDFEWAPENWSVVKVPLTAGRIAALEQALGAMPHGAEVRRRYSAGGNVAWLALPPQAQPAAFGAVLSSLGLAGLLVLASPGAGPRLLGHQPGAAFARRVSEALDPEGKFSPQRH